MPYTASLFQRNLERARNPLCIRWGGIIKRIWKSLSQISCDDDIVKIIILMVAERLSNTVVSHTPDTSHYTTIRRVR